MTEDDLAVIVLHLPQSDEAAPFGDRAGSVAGDLKSLGVEINAGLRVGHQNAFGPPLPQGCCSSRVHILLLVVTGLRLQRPRCSRQKAQLLKALAVSEASPAFNRWHMARHSSALGRASSERPAASKAREQSFKRLSVLG